MVPAHPLVTEVAVYPALFFFIDQHLLVAIHVGWSTSGHAIQGTRGFPAISQTIPLANMARTDFTVFGLQFLFGLFVISTQKE